MGTFEVTRARQRLGFTPSTGAPIRADVRGTGGIGGAIGQTALGIGKLAIAIHEKRQQMTDDISRVEADRLRKNGNLEFEQYKLDNTQDTWHKFRQEQSRRIAGEVNTLPFSKNELMIQSARSDSYSETSSATALIDATNQLQTETRKVQIDAMVEAFATGNIQDQDDAVQNFRNGEATKAMGSEMESLIIKAAQKKGAKIQDGRQKNTVLAASLTQRNAEGILDVEAANRVIDASDLPADKKLDLSQQITTKAGQEKALSDDLFQGRQGDATEQLSEQLRNNTLTNAIIDAVDLQAIGDQKQDEFKWKQNFKKILRGTLTRTEPLVSNEAVYDALTVGSELVKRGTKSPAEWEMEFNTANAEGQLNFEDRRALRSKDIVATESMQNTTFTQTTQDNKPSLIEVSEGELASLQTAQKLAIQRKDITSIEALNKALQKNQIQRWNFGRYRTELRTQIAQHPEWSQKQIFTASDILIEQFDKPFEELVNEFDNSNPNRAITKTPPDEIFKDIWSGLSQDDKALIWSERLAGTPVQILLDSDEVKAAEKK